MSEVAIAPAAPVVQPQATPAAPAVVTPVVVPPVQPATPGQPAASSAPEAKGAPEKYAEFKAEGVALNAEAVTKWNDHAKTLGYTQEQYDGALKFQTEFVKGEIAKYDAQIEADFKSRDALTAKDPVLGGASTVANVANAQRAMAAFGNDAELKAAIESRDTPSGTYLAFMRFAAKVGAAIKEDSVAGTQGGGGEGADTSFEGRAKNFYAKAPVVQTNK